MIKIYVPIFFDDYFVETSNWSEPLVYGSIPSARFGHSACVIGDGMYVYGGSVDHSEFSNDLYMLWTLKP